MSAPKEGPSGDNQEQTYERSAHIIDISTDPKDASQPQNNQQATSKKIKRSKPRWRWWVKRFLHPMTLLTVVLAGLAWWQSKATQEQLDEMVMDSLNSSRQLTQNRMQIGTLIRDARANEIMAQATKDSLDLARTNFIKDQRPWLLPNAILPEPGVKIFSLNTPLTYRAYFSNYGRSPAMNVVAVGAIFFGPMAHTELRAWFKEWGHQNIVRNALVGKGGMSPPGGPPPMEAIEKDGPLVRVGFQQISFKAPRIPNAYEVGYIRSQNDGVMIGLRIEYTDSAGNAYYTHVCRGSLAGTSALHNCEDENHDQSR